MFLNGEERGVMFDGKIMEKRKLRSKSNQVQSREWVHCMGVWLSRGSGGGEKEKKREKRKKKLSHRLSISDR